MTAQTSDIHSYYSEPLVCTADSIFALAQQTASTAARPKDQIRVSADDAPWTRGWIILEKSFWFSEESEERNEEIETTYVYFMTELGTFQIYEIENKFLERPPGSYPYRAVKITREPIKSFDEFISEFDFDVEFKRHLPSHSQCRERTYSIRSWEHYASLGSDNWVRRLWPKGAGLTVRLKELSSGTHYSPQAAVGTRKKAAPATSPPGRSIGNSGPGGSIKQKPRSESMGRRLGAILTTTLFGGTMGAMVTFLLAVVESIDYSSGRSASFGEAAGSAVRYALIGLAIGAVLGVIRTNTTGGVVRSPSMAWVIGAPVTLLVLTLVWTLIASICLLVVNSFVPGILHYQREATIGGVCILFILVVWIGAFRKR